MLYYLTQQIQNQQFTNLFQQKFSGFLLLFLVVFSFLNWYFEVDKWKYLASSVQPISRVRAFRQSLISFSVSLLTPNRVGEYGIKVLFFPKEIRKTIFIISLIGNFSQLAITLFMGVFGLIILLWRYSNQTLTQKFFDILDFSPLHKLIMIVVLGLIMIVAYFWLVGKKQLWNQRKNWLNALNFSLLRYITFSFQFLFLLQYFTGNNNWILLYAGINITYFLSALIPMLSFLDWVVKGSVALSVFAGLGVSVNIVLNVVALMWISNFVLPFLVGMFLVWQTKIGFK